MTAIAALVDEKGTVWMGGDSAGVQGWLLQKRKDEKVFRVGDYVFGCSGSFRMMQVLRYGFIPPKPAIPGHAAMVKQFIPALRKEFTKAGWTRKKDEREDVTGHFLVGHKGHLYGIHGDLQVAEFLAPYAAEGCGEDIVLGSLFSTTQSFVTPDERILIALHAAQEHSAGVRGPFRILNTKNKKELVEE